VTGISCVLELLRVQKHVCIVVSLFVIVNVSLNLCSDIFLVFYHVVLIYRILKTTEFPVYYLDMKTHQEKYFLCCGTFLFQCIYILKAPLLIITLIL